MDEVTNEIHSVVTSEDFEKGLSYDEDMITPLTAISIPDGKKFNFFVESQKYYDKYQVDIVSDGLKIISTFCTCPKYNIDHSCKHIAATLISYSNKIFYKPSNTQIKFKSNLLLSEIANLFNEEPFRKERVNLRVYLNISSSYYGTYATLKLKIGLNKLYALIPKFPAFYKVLEHDEEFSFGKDFVYDPSFMYLSDKDISLIKYINEIRKHCFYDSAVIKINDDIIKYIIKNYKEYLYDEDSESKIEYVEGFPVEISLKKDLTDYVLTFKDEYNNIDKYTDDCEYMYKDKTIYHLDKNMQILLRRVIDDDILELKFSEEELPIFQKGVLRIVKNNLKIDDNVDLVVDTKPLVRFYFDLNLDDIECVPKFIYQSEEVSYFENRIDILRNIDYENEVTSILYDYGFHKDQELFYLQELDLMADFMDTGIDEISSKYQVFTSERLKGLSILKNSSVNAHFHLGSDNILRYDFSLDGVSDDEIFSLLSTLKTKQKYYRLKSGNIIDLQSKGIRDLANLSSDLEIESPTGEIPKYRALYLDSVRESKYDIVSTDSLFDKFINDFKKYKNVEITFSKDELANLRDYQIDGVKWLYTIYKCGFGGILADEMGLGKSMQTLYFIRQVLKENMNSKVLIIAPTSLIYNWENEIHKWCPEISYQILTSFKEERHKALEEFDKTIYITSYGTLREDVDYYKEKEFDVCIIDEAQNIKNPASGISHSVKNIKSSFKLALTGTPIENSIIELWSIFDFVMPGFLSSQKHFQEKYKFNDFNDEVSDMLSHLKRQVKPFILRRKKSDVTKELPPKLETNIFIDLDEKEKALYAAEVKACKLQMEELMRNGGFNKNKIMILSLLTRLRQMCIDPSIIYPSYKDQSSKINELIKLINESVSNGHKILLFTSFKRALDIVKERLDNESITSYTIAGDVSSKKRQMLVDAFNKDKTNVFLIMLKSGGVGLNLTSADVVIHLDLWWNPQAENQATDRTHRIGQTKTVEVVKLVCKGTVEEKILALQEKKKKLADTLIDNDLSDNVLNTLSEDDIKDLLAYHNKERV